MIVNFLDDALVGGSDAAIDLRRRLRSRRSTAFKPAEIKKNPCPKERNDGITKDSASEDLGGPSSRGDSSLDGICSRYRRLSEQCPTIAKDFAIDHVIVQSAQGVSVAELAKQFQRTERTIYNWLSKG